MSTLDRNVLTLCQGSELTWVFGIREHCANRRQGLHAEYYRGRTLGMSPDQCRQARDVLKWTREELAGAAGVTPRVVAAFEEGCDVSHAHEAAIQTALEPVGISFSFEIANGRARPAGVTARDPARRMSHSNCCVRRFHFFRLGNRCSDHRKDHRTAFGVQLIPPRRWRMPRRLSSAAIPLSGTIACINRPCVSTRTCRFLPLIFLPAS